MTGGIVIEIPYAEVKRVRAKAGHFRRPGFYPSRRIQNISCSSFLSFFFQSGSTRTESLSLIE